MSTVYFHSTDGDARLAGAERYHCSGTCSRIALALLDMSSIFGEDPIVKLVSRAHHIHQTPRDLDALATSFSIGSLDFVLPDGRMPNAFHVTLNTVLTVGDDVLRLMARLHGQCEIHGYVEGSNRRWFAGLIQRGLAEHLLREDMGWDAVCRLLLLSASTPVVTSYSVTDSFPNNPGEDEDTWYSLSKEDQWALSLLALRTAPSSLLEWKPEDWSTARFADGITSMDIRTIANGLK